MVQLSLNINFLIYYMKLKINTKPNLEKIDFLCDGAISKKLEKYELFKEFLNRYNTTIFLGKQGSGKTSLLINFVKIYKKCFNKIYVFMPLSSRNSLKNNIFDKLDEEQIYDELNLDNIMDLYERLKENSDNDLKSMVIFDDVQKGCKDNEVVKYLKNIVANQRHLKVVNFILLQNFYALDAGIRELINNVIIFKMDKKQTEKIFNEYIEKYKDKFLEVNRFVYDKPYNWLFLNLNSQRLFKNFDEILLDDIE